MENAIKEFFTSNAMLTFGGASAAVWIFTSAFRLLFKTNSVVFVFVASLIVSFVGAYIAGTYKDLVGIFLWLLNGCLLFCSAAGIQETFANAAKPKPVGKIEPHGARPFKFLSSYFD
jgi:hypothetical protein